MFLNTQREKYPVLLLRDSVVFAGLTSPIYVKREKSVKALESALENSKYIFLVAQKNATDDEPADGDIFTTGMICKVLVVSRLPDGKVKAFVEGINRAELKELTRSGDFIEAEVRKLEDKLAPENEETKALISSAIKKFGEYMKLNRKIPPEILTEIGKIKEAGKLADMIASYLPMPMSEKQKLLENLDAASRLETAYAAMQAEIDLVKAEIKIHGRVINQIEKNQRDYYLNEKMKAIQKEVDGEDVVDEMEELRKTIASLKLSDEAKEKADAEFKKLKSMSAMSSEASIIRTYLDWITTIPWSENSDIKDDIIAAEEVLDDDHYGLEQVKERIMEYLAVQSRTKKMRGPILCLVGPPGVGKTSLGRSIATATGREFAKISLGGMRDEAEIRGHRRTYLGAMPGKIIQSMKKAKKSNPLLLLDEIDKMSADFRGDPASALLEVLDPEQNKNFNDHYMEIDYDLSDVMFIATANSLNLPRPLLDRMEIIRISGYTEEEKIEIAKRHLIPKSIKDHGLQENEWSITRPALLDLIHYYTREAGVRNLERELANLIRKAVKEIVAGKTKSVKVTAKNLEKYAKIRKFNYGKKEESDLVGITTGLAYTETGGDILQIEAVSVPGKGKVSYTGNLKKVMEESIQAAASFVRSRSASFGISLETLQETDIHVHVPEGATPKDGPSAGVAMATSIVSVLTNIPVKNDLAMTGEITLRGRVLPIGGLKEKLLAALRSGINTVLIPEDNVKDLAEIPDNVKSKINIIPVCDVSEVLENALTQPIVAIEWGDIKQIPAAESSSNETLRSLQ